MQLATPDYSIDDSHRIQDKLRVVFEKQVLTSEFPSNLALAARTITLFFYLAFYQQPSVNPSLVTLKKVSFPSNR
jgi:hypothetical protein